MEYLYHKTEVRGDFNDELILTNSEEEGKFAVVFVRNGHQAMRCDVNTEQEGRDLIDDLMGGDGESTGECGTGSSDETN